LAQESSQFSTWASGGDQDRFACTGEEAVAYLRMTRLAIDLSAGTVRVSSILVVLLCWLVPAGGAVTNSNFAASLTNGSLSGTQFVVHYSYDASGISGAAEDYLPLLSFDFALRGIQFSRTNIQQGGQVIFHYSKIYNVTAEFYPAIDGPSNAPVNNIAFGFGGPGVIGYTDTNAQYGSGVFFLNPSNSPPQTLSMTVVTNCVRISFKTTSNAQYVVQYTDNLYPTNWITFTNLSGNGSTVTVTDSGVALRAKRFYRAGVLP